jgi:hypothetical protein
VPEDVREEAVTEAGTVACAAHDEPRTLPRETPSARIEEHRIPA